MIDLRADEYCRNAVYERTNCPETVRTTVRLLLRWTPFRENASSPPMPRMLLPYISACYSCACPPHVLRQNIHGRAIHPCYHSLIFPLERLASCTGYIPHPQHADGSEGWWLPAPATAPVPATPRLLERWGTETPSHRQVTIAWILPPVGM